MIGPPGWENGQSRRSRETNILVYIISSLLIATYTAHQVVIQMKIVARDNEYSTSVWIRRIDFYFNFVLMLW